MSHDGREVLQRTNQKIRKGRRRRLKRRVLFFFAIFVFVISLVSFLAHRPSVRVASVSVAGVETLSVGDIQKVVSAKLAGNFLYLFPRNTVFFISKRALEKELVRTYPRIETIDVSIEKRELQVFLAERSAAYLWCGPEPFRDVTDERPCYYFDKSGFIFDSAPYFSAAVYFTVYDDYVPEREDDTSPVGGYIAHTAVITDLLSFVASLETLGIRGFALSLNDGVATLYLGKAKDAHAPKVIWNIDDDYAHIGGNLSSALSIEPMKTDVFASDKELDYIDLRYKDKVYYKLKQ